MKKRIQHVKVWHRLARELHDINAALEDTARQRNLCAMPAEMERYGGCSNNHAQWTNQTSFSARE
uniref:Uncharacterized protein n=1 Tax=Arundo donax TaxID=35708 RepID=A0A0A9H7G2_ARUDO